MANSWKTLSDGDINRMALASFHEKSKFLKTVNRSYDDRFAKIGAKNGGSILLREPNRFTTRSGAVMQTQTITERTQTLTALTQYGVDLDISSIDHTHSIDDFQERVVSPAMDQLNATVESDAMASLYKDVFNLTGTPATTPASQAAVLNAGARLTQNLAPSSDRHVFLDPIAMSASVAALGTYFHKASELDRAFSDALIGNAANFNWWESAMVPAHTNGSRDDTTPVMDTSTIANGATTITTTGADGTFNKGDVFTIAGVYAVNPETKAAYSHLQQFVITADHTNDATDVLAIAPTIYISGALQNVSVTSAGGGKAIVNVAAGGSGAASTAYTQNLAYHKDAFTFVTVDMYTDPKLNMTTTRNDGVSMRLWRSGDIINDTFPMRIDIMCGWKTTRPEWAVRVRG